MSPDEEDKLPAEAVETPKVCHLADLGTWSSSSATTRKPLLAYWTALRLVPRPLTLVGTGKGGVGLSWGWIGGLALCGMEEQFAPFLPRAREVTSVGPLNAVSRPELC